MATRHRRDVVENLRAWFDAKGGTEDTWNNDKKMMLWLTEKADDFAAYIDREKAKTVAEKVSGMITASSPESLKMVMSSLSADERDRIIAALK